MPPFEPLDPVVHAPVRLAVLTILVSVREADFTYLKEATATTDGNLSTHLSKLEQAGYIEITKQFVGKKPQTRCRLTDRGRTAFQNYVAALENYLRPGSIPGS
jgi:DNA-binding MarR family transcriptional regulator